MVLPVKVFTKICMLLGDTEGFKDVSKCSAGSDNYAAE